MSHFSNTTGGVAPGTSSAAMIMEGLETLVAPSHHAFLLTESAAAAHFNVLSFDTCLFKTAAQTSPTSTTQLTPSSGLTPQTTSTTLLHYSLSSNNSNNRNTQQIISTSISDTEQSHQRNIGSSVQTTTSTTIISSNNSRSSASHLSLLNTGATSTVNSSTDTTSSRQDQTDSSDTQTGDLNTPVTTSSDIPSFFGPSTVVEPPPITG